MLRSSLLMVINIDTSGRKKNTHWLTDNFILLLPNFKEERWGLADLLTWISYCHGFTQLLCFRYTQRRSDGKINTSRKTDRQTERDRSWRHAGSRGWYNGYFSNGQLGFYPIPKYVFNIDKQISRFHKQQQGKRDKIEKGYWSITQGSTLTCFLNFTHKILSLHRQLSSSSWCWLQWYDDRLTNF